MEEDLEPRQENNMKHRVTFEPVVHKTIIIEPLTGGWLVKVGCQSMVYTDGDKLIKDFIAYINDPQQVEREFSSNSNQNGGPTEGPCGPRDARVVTKRSY
jgi:hypothetical protein